MSHTISVCIPTCDRPDLLAETIRSCTAQTRPPDELVIGDDSKADTTEQFIEQLRPTCPVPLNYRRNTPRLGQNANINSLFDRAQGSHLVLLHDDDLLTPNALADLLACWDLHPDLTGAFGKQYILLHNGVRDLPASERLNQLYRRTSAQAGLQPHGWEVGLSQQFPNNGYMLRSEAARTIRWRPIADVGNGGDFDFGLRLGLEYDKFFFVDTYTSEYRLTSGGSISSSTTDDAALRSYWNVARMDLPPAAEACRADKLARSAPHAMMQALRHGKKNEAWKIYRSPSHPWRVRLSPGGLRRLLLLLKP